ncbi:helix-turn-helix domain-containing protein [Crossiella sp. SN42]|uniref:helix-turn-helix transcriptional regulator n=1 Tax=Crossiella sp. SN42 TaxID=2944808 RepID=UPI00207D0BCD|nr:helix-turn-helix domain-containing protein [Crossiella sp. SN42]MCO1579113.1 helix-turn-helix domain-containing protein [Crossiella sp. SN42]
MADSLDARVAAVAALEEPTRRRVYDHVARQGEAVTKDEVAGACDLPRTTAAFHLDRLAEQGLLDVVFERRTGRSGPGAGRPAKLYRRSARQVEVTLPERRYELAGLLLAAAVEDAERTGETPRTALDRRAEELGRSLGEAARGQGRAGAESVLAVLERHGFEPRVTDDGIALGNCPFHSLAHAHTALVCGMNLCLLSGLLAGLGATGARAELAPAAGHCCVRVRP